jgi:oligopeptide/dipeptide ABC transporter ATP-binding protein
VRHMSDRIAVMYLGKIVEEGDGESVCRHPAHPYTKALISAVPTFDPAKKTERLTLRGEIPSRLSPPRGCAFHPRCPSRVEICERQEPVMEQNRTGHWIACHRPDLEGFV